MPVRVRSHVSAEMAMLFYREHYHDKISPNLSDEQKIDVVKRISDMTLYEPFAFTGVDYIDRFPELKPYVGVSLSGLYLVAIMEGIIGDQKRRRMGHSPSPRIEGIRRRPIRVQTYRRRR